jgi:hypothetical protein
MSLHTTSLIQSTCRTPKSTSKPNGLFAGRRGAQIASRYSLIRTSPLPFTVASTSCSPPGRTVDNLALDLARPRLVTAVDPVVGLTCGGPKLGRGCDVTFLDDRLTWCREVLSICSAGWSTRSNGTQQSLNPGRDRLNRRRVAAVQTALLHWAIA